LLATRARRVSITFIVFALPVVQAVSLNIGYRLLLGVSVGLFAGLALELTIKALTQRLRTAGLDERTREPPGREAEEADRRRGRRSAFAMLALLGAIDTLVGLLFGAELDVTIAVFMVAIAITSTMVIGTWLVLMVRSELRRVQERGVPHR
jgi:NhaP-type Na+/H+ or K+/H+ antiporter